MNKKLFLLVIITLLNLNCKSVSKKAFVYTNNEEKIELQVPENQILLDGKTIVKIKLKNIKIAHLNVVGVGASVVDATEDTMTLRILTRSSFHKDNKKYTLRVSYKKDGKRVHHVFYIPLKKAKK